MPLFQPLLKESWRLIWNKPWILVFGLLTSFLGGGGFRELILNSSEVRDSATLFAIHSFTALRTGAVISTPLNVMRGAFKAPGSALLGLLVIVASALVAITLFWLASIAQAALIDTARKHRRTLRTNMLAGWAVGKRFGWHILGMHVALKLLVGLLFFIVGVVTASTLRLQMMSQVIGLIAVLVLFLGALIAALVSMYAANAIVLRDYGIWEGLRFAFKLFLKNWLTSIETAALFLLLQIVFGIVGLITSSIITLPFFFLFLIAQSIAIPFPFAVVLVVWIALAIILLAFLTALLSAWQTLVWSSLFFELTEQENVRPALLRLIRKFRS